MVVMCSWMFLAVLAAAALAGAGVTALFAYHRASSAAHKLLDLLDALHEHERDMKAAKEEWDRDGD